ncbi:hypothetical protein GCM10025858_18200 [Alicyclobacillus sacchari]|uniref:hypothetical protein n=1 Tax=Alicyclobacillus sacchari TaxID=392010 RepID=UPI0023E94CDC|nr:hypothetical protein GCM10025858_18200 [Alicyclobacillus sacchari]
MQEDTIAAIATAIGEGSVGIVRVSGEMAQSIGEKLVRTPSGRPLRLARRTMRYGHVVQPGSDDPLDEAIVLWMPGPHSYTGEDVLELQVHGGVHVLQSVLAACLAAGARMAEPGSLRNVHFSMGGWTCRKPKP